MDSSNTSDRQTAVSSSHARTVRSDVAGQTESVLRQTGHVLHQKIACDCRDGVLILRGTVPSYYLRQVAQKTVFPRENVNQIENRMEVVTSDLSGINGVG